MCRTPRGARSCVSQLETVSPAKDWQAVAVSQQQAPVQKDTHAPRGLAGPELCGPRRDEHSEHHRQQAHLGTRTARTALSPPSKRPHVRSGNVSARKYVTFRSTWRSRTTLYSGNIRIKAAQDQDALPLCGCVHAGCVKRRACLVLICERGVQHGALHVFVRRPPLLRECVG